MKNSLKSSLNLKLVTLGVTAAIVSGCTWVKPSPEATKVRLVPADRVADCRQIGGVSTYTQSTITGVERSDKKVASELITLAKNDAAKRGADTIAIASPAKNGQQEFNLYRCL